MLRRKHSGKFSGSYHLLLVHGVINDFSYRFPHTKRIGEGFFFFFFFPNFVCDIQRQGAARRGLPHSADELGAQGDRRSSPTKAQSVLQDLSRAWW